MQPLPLELDLDLDKELGISDDSNTIDTNDSLNGMELVAYNMNLNNTIVQACHEWNFNCH